MSYNRLTEESLNKSPDDLSHTDILSDTIISNLDRTVPDNLMPDSRVLNPMSAWAGSATVINLVLATGPFSYPYAFVQCGVIISTILMLLTMIIAYMTATFMIESISICCAKRYKGRTDSLFPLIKGEDPNLKMTRDQADLMVKESPFYIRQKLEIGAMASDLIPVWLKYIMFFFLILYMYGAMCLKYVAGSKSMVEGISVTIFGDVHSLEHKIHFDPYYIAIFIFAGISIYFSFGNIENAKILQIVTTILRFVVTFLMIIGSIISLFLKNGGVAPAKNMVTVDFDYLNVLFGNTIFIFI